VVLILDKNYFIVLGASIDQKMSIITANRLGFKTLVFDKNSKAECRKYANKFFCCSSTDFFLIKKKIKNYKNKIKGVIAQGSDIPRTVSKIEKYLNIKNRVPLRAAIICTDKQLMKDFFKKNKIPTTKLVNNYTRNSKLKFPLVVKPVDMSGSKGVLLCKNKNELKYLLKRSKDESIKKKIILEEFCTGPQLSIETLIIDDNCYTFGFAERNYSDTKSFYPNILENGGIQPAQNYIKYKPLINQYIKKISKKLNIKNGVIKSDIVINNNKIFFIEIALRLSGGDFSETLIPESTGIDIIKYAIMNAAGLKIDYFELNKKQKNLFIANRYFFSQKKELLKKIMIPNEIKKLKWVKKIQFSKKLKIEKTTSHRDRFGVFIVSARSISVLKKRIKYIYNKIKISDSHLKQNSSMILKR
jgi:biotin carboxylase